MKRPSSLETLYGVAPVKQPIPQNFARWKVQYREHTSKTGMYEVLHQGRKKDHSGPLQELMDHLASLLPEENEYFCLDNMGLLNIIKGQSIEFFVYWNPDISIDFEWRAVNKKILNRFLDYFKKYARTKKERFSWMAEHFGFIPDRYCIVKRTKKGEVIEPLIALTAHLAEIQKTTPKVSFSEMWLLIIYKGRYIHFYPQPPNSDKVRKFSWKKIDTKLVDAFIENCGGKLFTYDTMPYMRPDQ